MDTQEDKLLNKQAKQIRFGGTILGSIFFILFWKQGFGLNVFLFITVILGIIQWAKFIIKQKWYFSKWDVLSVLYWIMSLGVVINDSASMNSIVSALMLFSFPYIAYLALYPETMLRFSYQNTAIIYFQQLLSPFSGLGTYFKSVRKAEDKKFLSPMALKVIWGLLLSLPVLYILTLILMNADEVFAHVVQQFFDSIDYFIREILNFDSVGDTFVLILMIMSGIWVGIGYVFAKLKFPIADNNYDVPKNGFDMVVSNVVLGSINLLFMVFIVVQLQYLFGNGNLSELGLTFSEYARKGYWELQAVTGIVGVIMYTLIRWGKKHGKIITVSSKINLVFLLLNTMVLLFSAVYRMGLYVDAYGLTLLRFYPLVFMGFELCLFLFLIPSVLSRKVFKQFSLYSFSLFMTIMVVLTFVSPERVTLNYNLSRVENGQEFDYSYHLSLSTDGWGRLIPRIQIGDLEYKDCLSMDKYTHVKDQKWQEWNYSKSQTFRDMEDSLIDKKSYFGNFLDDCEKTMVNRI